MGSMNQGEIARLYCDASYGLNGIFDTNDNENPESSEHEEEVGKRLVFEIELCYWHTPPPSPWALPSDEKFQEAEKHRAIVKIIRVMIFQFNFKDIGWKLF